ncbi:hypothetical protein S7711_10902 [Stachybotrys chartarum IBT 7711]|uniref:Uncharacterized protein n=1 Tax=Stachybotrys chartarum (strain CBS 109288 / IBT 7711) TaxID=1280523 RepID=A0A084AMF4_STACB|nr:hypothetical protein S7711_10902 [Stachybotrys chartarum IBT 7711]KFA79108.1 hypothetical protein S40288_11212 [Stachybotrys chartarum IBT 40288]
MLAVHTRNASTSWGAARDNLMASSTMGQDDQLRYYQINSSGEPLRLALCCFSLLASAPGHCHLLGKGKLWIGAASQCGFPGWDPPGFVETAAGAPPIMLVAPSLARAPFSNRAPA